MHLWSLAIEEQFYLLWPLVLSVLLLGGRRAALALTVAAAIGSAVWMAAQFVPGADPSRLYYGTDTRLTGLLLGAGLAFVWVPIVHAGEGAPPVPRLWSSRRVGRLVDLLGMAGLVGLAWLLATADAFAPFLYRGGLALVAIATVALITAVVHPRSRLGSLLDSAPLRWIGTRSYGIYLWHWPIFSLTRPGIDVALDPIVLLAIRLSLTALVAELSFRVVEAPIRSGAIERGWAQLRHPESHPDRRSRWWVSAATAGAVAVGLSAVVVSVAVARPPATPAGLVTTSIDGLMLPPDAMPSAAVRATTSPGASARAARHSPAPTRTASFGPPTTPAPPSAVSTADTGPTGEPSPSAVASVAPPVSPQPSASPPILAFGESVMLQSATALAQDLGPVRVDAAVGRQINQGITILEHREAAGTLAGTVIVQLGNNGPFYDGQFDEVMAALRDVPLVIWINVRVPREWEAHNNRIIASGVARYPNARMVDWNAATEGRADLFWADGYHPRPAGAKLYADLVAAALR
jgi:hypothetical protein